MCKLKKALYGFKQAPMAWYERIDSYLIKLEYSENGPGSDIYFKISYDDMLILVLLFDDFIIIGEYCLIVKWKHDLASEFDMKYLGLLHYFLGLEVWQKENYIFLNQRKYTIEILTKIGMMDDKPLSTPMEKTLHKLKSDAFEYEPTDPTYYKQIIWYLMYLVNTLPDICYETNALIWFTCEPKKIILMEGKNILRYLHCTIGLGLKYDNVEIQLQGYSDSEWADSSIDHKSTIYRILF